MVLGCLQAEFFREFFSIGVGFLDIEMIGGISFLLALLLGAVVPLLLGAVAILLLPSSSSDNELHCKFVNVSGAFRSFNKIILTT